MTTGMKKIVTIGTVLAALVLSAPAYAKLALPEGYQLPSSEPTTFASLPDANQRQAEPVGVNQRQLETIASLNAGTGVTRADDFAPPKTGPSLVAGDDSVVDWNQVGIGIGIALLLAGLGGAALTRRTRERAAHP